MPGIPADMRNMRGNDAAGMTEARRNEGTHAADGLRYAMASGRSRSRLGRGRREI